MNCLINKKLFSILLIPILLIFFIVQFIFPETAQQVTMYNPCDNPINPSCTPSQYCDTTPASFTQSFECYNKTSISCTKKEDCKQAKGKYYLCRSDKTCWLGKEAYESYSKDKSGKCDKMFDGKCYYNMGQMTEAECKKKKEDADTANIGQYKFISVDKTCYFDQQALDRYNANQNKDDLIKPPKISPPVLRINIPGIDFSALSSTMDAQGYLNLPWIGQYLAATYKFALVAISILAILMIMMQAFKILGGMGWMDTKNKKGEKERVAVAWKKIGQIFFGISIAWGSYALLYNINPELVEFQSLKIKYIEEIELPESMYSNEPTIPPDYQPTPTALNPKYKPAFTTCPITLTNPTVLTGSVEKDPRNVEFYNKIGSFINGKTVSERIKQAGDAMAVCKIHGGNCGRTAGTIYTLAGVVTRNNDRSCLFRSASFKRVNGKLVRTSIAGCNTHEYSKYIFNTPSRLWNDEFRKFKCNNKTKCVKTKDGNGKTIGYEYPTKPTCTDSSQEARIKVLTAMMNDPAMKKLGYPDKVADQLQPGDIIWVYNGYPACTGLHSTMFLGWIGDGVAYTLNGQQGYVPRYFKQCLKYTCGKKIIPIIKIMRPI